MFALEEEQPPASQPLRMETFSFKSQDLAPLKPLPLTAQMKADPGEALGYSGDRKRDAVAANAAAGFRHTPTGYTWHHHQDGRTMQLVPTDLHRAISHTGGHAAQKALEAGE